MASFEEEVASGESVNPEIKDRPLLSIAIPTRNRSRYLSLNLHQLRLMFTRSQMKLPVEVIVSDNASTDDTFRIVESIQSSGLPIRYVCNHEDIGSDRNIAQCFRLSAGSYVLILGDDDLLVDGALLYLTNALRGGPFGVVSMRSYGYDQDFRLEYPGGSGNSQEFFEVGRFVERLGIYSTLVSANIISKDLLTSISPESFCGTSLVHTHMLYRAAGMAERNLWIGKYLVACKRNNSGGYSFSEVFVDQLGSVLDQMRGQYIPEGSVVRLEKRILRSYYPYYLVRQLWVRDPEMEVAPKRYLSRFRHYKAFWLYVAPILYLPRLCALVWGVGAVIVGRVFDGDLRRGVKYALSRISDTYA
jgi:glycosyltransferase involved in cell wall biosynthesis